MPWVHTHILTPAYMPVVHMHVHSMPAVVLMLGTYWGPSAEPSLVLTGTCVEGVALGS